MMAASRLEENGPKNLPYFFRKSPLNHNSSRRPLQKEHQKADDADKKPHPTPLLIEKESIQAASRCFCEKDDRENQAQRAEHLSENSPQNGGSEWIIHAGSLVQNVMNEPLLKRTDRNIPRKTCDREDKKGEGNLPVSLKASAPPCEDGDREEQSSETEQKGILKDAWRDQRDACSIGKARS